MWIETSLLIVTLFIILPSWLFYYYISAYYLDDNSKLYHYYQLSIYYYNRYLYTSAHRHRVQPWRLRSIFYGTPLLDSRKTDVHPHPSSAADRTAAGAYCEAFALSCSCRPFFVQCSRSDQRKLRAGSRTYHWAKDFMVHPAASLRTDNDMEIYIDVDYYLDMPTQLSQHFRPTLLYTFTPECAATSTDEIMFTFLHDGSVQYHLTGGAGYMHHLWNYACDTLMISSWRRVVVYLVDRRPTHVPHRSLILLTPLCCWNFPMSVFIMRVITGTPLDRLNPIIGKFIRLRLLGRTTTDPAGTSRVSTALVGSYSSATISSADDDRIASMARLSKLPLSIAQVQSVVPDHSIATVIAEYHRTHQPCPIPIVFPPHLSANNYQLLPERPYEVTRPCLVPFMSSPFPPTAYVPDICYNNDAASVIGRIENVRSTATLDSRYLGFAKEFITAFVCGAVLHPVDFDRVYEKQSRPTQRHILDTGSLMDKPRRIIEAFMKKESYDEPKDPRVISTINGKDKLRYSRYTYALANHAKRFPWYAFSKTPLEIATRVASLCVNSPYGVLDSDLNRMDGRVAPALRMFEILLFYAAFAETYHEDICELHSAQFRLSGRTSEGVGYESGYARASGSGETGILNTLDNAYMNYCAIRLTQITADIPAAMAYLGIYGGDDGLSLYINPPTLTKACEALGQVAKVHIVLHGQTGVTFLARIYSPYVWFGDPSSCCDIPRTMIKFHLSMNLPMNVSPAMKLLEKARSLALTDSQTPMVGCFVRRALELAPLRFPRLPQLSTWWARFAENDQYPNHDNGWMDGYFYTVLPAFDLAFWQSWVAACSDIDMLLHAPICYPEPVAALVLPRPVVINGLQHGHQTAHSAVKRLQRRGCARLAAGLLPTPLLK